MQLVPCDNETTRSFLSVISILQVRSIFQKMRIRAANHQINQTQQNQTNKQAPTLEQKQNYWND